MSGIALADGARALFPGLPVLFMSGYPLRTLEREHGASPEKLVPFLSKPFLAETFLEAVSTLVRPDNVPGG
jgi:hypothetical protein